MAGWVSQPATLMNEMKISPALSFPLSIMTLMALYGCAANQPADNSVDTSGVEREGISAWVEDDQLHLSNNSDKDIYYEVFPEEMLALIEWAPCEDVQACQDQRLMPEEKVSLPIKRITTKDTLRITVFYWHLEAHETGQRFQVTNMSSIDLDLDS